MKRLAASLLLSAFGALGAVPQALAVDLTLGHVLSEDSHYHAAATKFAELVSEKSKGDINVTVFPAGQLGGEVQMIQNARSGAIDLVVTGEPPLENTVPELAVLSLPYLFDTTDAANAALQGKAGDKLLSYIDKHDLVGLGFVSVFERSVYGTKPVRSLDDMKGFKIRVIQGPGFVGAYEALGAQSTPMAYSEVFLALQSGVVDGAEASPEQLIQDKFVEATKYFNLTRVHHMAATMIMSKAAFDRLTPEQQAIVREAGKEASAASIDVYKKNAADGLEELKKAGIEIIEPDLAPFMEKARGAWDGLLANIPEGKENLELLTAK
ncbi:TRAP-type C4-dicarboxylate transport system, periplasmic component [Nitratireductor indicus C115]|uniref:TRAP-type C4-dicarboxylate transport system, periplasmic component n=1 Tax=Nitratireductor indicus C115 TaxID=1231190 RepID=K2PSW2_9HYPH|nr:TRAP transporter substrate-binding protein [Nitratireductor indicus]EKF44177.1 TRAP-type C4-dicarboxylate transport system, periplasmic component [Nitratireductor indicus C115]SFQ24783.1 tripartite ATP-independent transporter solute receptor, DctP family [Nitratireductor indicus]